MILSTLSSLLATFVHKKNETTHQMKILGWLLEYGDKSQTFFHTGVANISPGNNDKSVLQFATFIVCNDFFSGLLIRGHFATGPYSP